MSSPRKRPASPSLRSQQSSQPANLKRLIPAALLLVGIGVLVFLLTRPEETLKQKAISFTTDTDEQAERSRPRKAWPSEPGLDPSGVDNTHARLTSVAHLTQILDDYREVAVYPHWSRAHTDGTEYKLKWNEPVASELSFDDSDPDGALVYRFNFDRAHVMFGEPLTTWIEVYRKDKPEVRVPLTVHMAWVMAVGGPKTGRTVQLTYRDDGKEGDVEADDMKYTNQFVPSQHAELRQALQVQIVAEIEYRGQRRQIMRDFMYSPRPVVEVLGVTDEIVDGNLVVKLKVEVMEPGLYTFEANVMDRHNEVAIAYTDVAMPLQLGEAVVALPFFGRAFHEKEIDGPYLVRDIRGLWHSGTDELNIPWSYNQTHLTKAYKRADLSGDAWDAPEKQEKIQGLERLIEDMKNAKGPVSDEPSPHLHIGLDGIGREVKDGMPLPVGSMEPPSEFVAPPQERTRK